MPLFYKFRKEDFIQQKLKYFIVWHMYIVYIALVCFYISFYALSVPSATG